MKKRHTQYLGLFIALVLMTYALSLASPQMLANTAGQLVANAMVGMNAGVLPNEFNSLAQALQDKETELKEREARLGGVEIEGGMFSTNTLAVASLAVSILLVILVGLNFFFDLRRGRRNTAFMGSVPIDLRAQR